MRLGAQCRQGGCAVGSRPSSTSPTKARAAEFAALRATGWSEPALGRLVTYEGVMLGLLGVVIGAAAGLGGAAWFVGDLQPSLIWAGAGTALVGLLVAGFAALAPALWLRRLPTSALLAEE
jgi:ABC-type antimicrobial peptide transport system permease subunit